MSGNASVAQASCAAKLGASDRRIPLKLHRLDLLVDEAQGHAAADQFECGVTEEVATPTREGSYIGRFALGGDLFQIVGIGDDLGGDALLVGDQLPAEP